MEVESGGDCDIGKRGLLVQQQDELGSLSQVRRCRARGRKSSGLGEELVRESGPIAW